MFRVETAKNFSLFRTRPLKKSVELHPHDPIIPWHIKSPGFSYGNDHGIPSFRSIPIGSM
jgi:hypothetical protein